uniref:Aegyptin/gSG7 salivary protein-like four-helix bundle domain-containing protein n=1 Tax=Anopheles epiroticus TaxID=199890 RepID=A0A240PPR9_9DIPT
MQAKLVFVLIALGVVCLLQATPSKALGTHVQQLMKVFRGLMNDIDYTKKPFYVQRAKYGVQNQLRNPLVARAASFSRNSKLSDACLKQMVTKAKDLEDTFYAGFSYNCHDHDQYSMECLQAAEPAYLTGLKAVAEETQGCLKEQ